MPGATAGRFLTQDSFLHREEIESYFEESEQAAAELKAARDAYPKQRPGM